jgi:hypothetical protein
VEIFFEKTGNPDGRLIFVGEKMGYADPDEDPKWDYEAMGRSQAEQQATGVRFGWTTNGRDMFAGVDVPEALLWRWTSEYVTY